MELLAYGGSSSQIRRTLTEWDLLILRTIEATVCFLCLKVLSRFSVARAQRRWDESLSSLTCDNLCIISVLHLSLPPLLHPLLFMGGHGRRGHKKVSRQTCGLNGSTRVPADVCAVRAVWLLLAITRRPCSLQESGHFSDCRLGGCLRGNPAHWLNSYCPLTLHLFSITLRAIMHWPASSSPLTWWLLSIDPMAFVHWPSSYWQRTKHLSDFRCSKIHQSGFRLSLTRWPLKDIINQVRDRQKSRGKGILITQEWLFFCTVPLLIHGSGSRCGHQ